LVEVNMQIPNGPERQIHERHVPELFEAFLHQETIAGLFGGA
jgi:hypothetical protein